MRIFWLQKPADTKEFEIGLLWIDMEGDDGLNLRTTLA